VVVATAGTLTEADVIRVSLEAAGIPAFVLSEQASNWMMHLGPAIHPRGIKVMVLPEHAAEAQAMLEAPRRGPDDDEPAGEEPPDEEEKPAAGALTPDDYAVRAYRAGLYFLVFNLIFPLAALYFVKALRAARTHPVRRPGRYAWHLAVAFVVGIGLPAGVAVLIVSQLPGC